jgi:hypothetical protein
MVTYIVGVTYETMEDGYPSCKRATWEGLSLGDAMKLIDNASRCASQGGLFHIPDPESHRDLFIPGRRIMRVDKYPFGGMDKQVPRT